ncbi:MAG TPA: sigma 54-interacting transcriptional regulator [Planctomycetota bacterium]|nr:sigma 54-interacting transcriptional regulator [Planctomycetota bacterium]
MKSPEPLVQTLPWAVPSGRPALSFPKRASVAELRRLRDKHFRDGQHELALQVATEVATREPGRESYLRYGMLLQQVGRYREALGVLRDALRFETGPKYLISDIHLHIAYTWFLMGKGKRVGESVRRADALRLKPRAAFNYHIMCGNFLISKRDFRGALLEYLEAEKSGPNRMCRSRAAINQGIALTRMWDFAAAQAPLDRALRMLKKGGHAAELAIARSARAAVCSELGHYGRALGIFLRAARTFRRLGKVDREAEVLSNAAYNAVASGQWSKARSISERAIALASTTGQLSVLACCYAHRAMACAQNEEVDLASSSLVQAQRLLRGRRDWVANLNVARARCRIVAISGKWTEVFRVARQAERLATKVGDAVRVVEFRRLRGDAEAHLGHGKASNYAQKSAGRLEALLRNQKASPTKRLASKLAASEMPILVVGEGGTNKTETAREIHRASARAKGPCVVVPCEHLSFPASDLYGHAEGAWSGATRSSQGYVASAQGGTIILDCIDQMSSEDQQILIPLLDGRTRAVGGVDERVLDVRVVATCSSMETLTHELRSRLEGAVLRIPALKEQKEGIPHQVTALLAGRRKISADALTELANHRWEGNIDELRGVVDRLVALSDESIGRKLVRRILMTTKTRRLAKRVHASRDSRREAVLAQ